MICFLSLWDEITTAIVKALRAMFLSLCELVYKFIIFFYSVFEKFGTAQLLRNDTVMQIYRRIGLILGLLMLFRLAFSFIQYVINPDLIADKQKGLGNIIKNVLIVIVLLGVTPTLFSEAYRLQGFLIRQNIVGKIITGKNYDTDDLNETGVELSWYAFSSFYRFSDYIYNSQEYENNPDLVKHNACPILSDDSDGGALGRDFRRTHTLRYAYNCVNTMGSKSENGIEYEYFNIDFDGNGLVPLITGILILWMIIMYTVQLGVRLLQLAYLELIAPIPIIMYLDPKNKDIISKWGKQCLTTFLDYFIRTGIIYFVIFIIKLLVTNEGSSLFMSAFDDLNLTSLGIAYVKIIMIIALLIFAKRVPKLLEEVFPVLKNAASLDFGLKMPKEMKQVGGIAAGAGLGVVGAGISGISRFRSNKAAGKSTGKSLLGGAYGVGAGLFKGVKSGFTKKGVSGGWKNILESNNKYNQLITSGGTTMGTIRAKVGDTLGESKGQEFTRLMANYQKIIDDNKYVNDVAENFSEIKKLKTRWETLRMSGASEVEINAAWDTYKAAKKAALTAALSGDEKFYYDESQYDSETKSISVTRGTGSGDLTAFENAAFAGQIKVRANDAEDFANSHNVKLVNSSGKSITSFKSADDFKDASVSASKYQTEILSENDFGAAIANDAAAGVDSNRTARKDK